MSSFLVDLFQPRAMAATPGPLSDFWYRDPESKFLTDNYGDAGIGIGAETILRCSTVLAAIRFRGDALAMCPPSTFKKTATGRVEDPTHYSQIVLRNPNPWQTGNRWRHLQSVWMAQWGNAYSEIRSGQRFAEELWPLHPQWMQTVDQRSDGTMLYLYKAPGQPEKRLGQERVLHFRDFSTDGVSGVKMYVLIRNVVGIALLAEKHAAAFLKKGAKLGGMLKPKNPLTDEARAQLRDSLAANLGGSVNTGTWPLLPFDIDVVPNPATNRDGQFVEIGEGVIDSILRFIGVPGVVVGYMGSKTATYASAKEFFESGGLKHCVLPMVANVEAEEEKALLVEGDTRQIKHNLDALQRANFQERTEGLVRSVGGPFRTVNEARRIEDMNELDDPRYDEVLTPSNMAPELLVPVDEPNPTFPPARPAPTPPEPEDGEQAKRLERANQLAHDAACRVVRREIAAIQGRNGAVGAAVRFARDKDGFKAWAVSYYDKHAEHVAEALRISDAAARQYADRQRDELIAKGISCVETWEERIAPELAGMALGGN